MPGFGVLPSCGLDRPQLDALRSLYEEAFQPWAREPFCDLMARERHGDAAAVILADGDEPVALAVTSCLASAGWSYLEYFAVTAARRGSGIGGELWRAAGRDLTARGQPGRLVLEVDDPDGAAAGSPQRHERERRIRFYRRQGAQPLPVRGCRVPHLDGTGDTCPMLLLWAAVSGDTKPPGTAGLSVLLPAVYAKGYALPAGHPLVRAALQASGAVPAPDGQERSPYPEP